MTYNDNGADSGSVPTDSTNYEQGQTVTVLGNTGSLGKTGYAYAGWNTSLDGSGDTYTVGQTFSMGSANVTLYARWTMNPGYKTTYTADGVSFTMAYVPGGITFPTGTDDSGSNNVSDAYWIGETEVTYELWYTVHSWAISNGYTFANPGREGNDGAITDPAGELPTVAKNEPVTTVNWHDSMVFCNAITEWYNAQNGTSYTCMYKDSGTPIRNSTNSNAAQCDGVTPDSMADGFRLLASMEYELAARYINDDGDNNLEAGEYYPGNYASGAYTYYNDVLDVNPNNSVVDGKEANDAVAVYGYYFAGSWLTTGVSSTAEVKSKTANPLGLYDMSGNVWEWCFDLISGIERGIRGGSWAGDAGALQVGYVNRLIPWAKDFNIGFRLARTAE